MNKKHIQAEQTKKKVANAARALFAQKGYKATSIEDIVEATECSKGNIYYHFKNKEDLFLYIMNEWEIEWEKKWKESTANLQSTRDKLYAMAEMLIDDEYNNPLILANNEFLQVEGTNDYLNDFVIQWVNFIQELIQEGIDRGEFKLDYPLDHISNILVSLFLGLGEVSKRSYNMNEAIALYQSAVNVVLFGIAR